MNCPKCKPVTLAILFAAAYTTACAAADTLAFVEESGRVLITIDGRPLATYVYEDAETYRPYFMDLHTPNGVQITRNHPPVEGVDRTDHPTFHPGLWMAYGDISGADFWRNRARVEHVRFVDAPRAADRRGGFTVENVYRDGDGEICREIAQYTFVLVNDGWFLLIDTVFSGESDVVFGDQEEMGLGLRIATPLSGVSAGEIRNSQGGRGESETWGKTAEWCAYSGELEGAHVGAVLIPHPDNFRPSWFHARDYGLLVANPFGREAFTGENPSAVVVESGESLRLRFGVFAFTRPSGTEVPGAEALEHYLHLTGDATNG